MHRADNKFSIWESQLIKHKAAPSVKRFASDHCRFNFKTVIIRNRQIKAREEQNEKSREKRLFRCGYSVWHKRFGRA